MITTTTQHAYDADVRSQHLDDPDFMHVFLIDHDYFSNLYTAYQKVYQNGTYVGIRLVTHVRYLEILNEDRFHFDPLELDYAVDQAKQRNNLTLPCFAYTFNAFKTL